MKKTRKYTITYLSVGLCFGVGIGMVLGNNVFGGSGMSGCIGAVFGMGLAALIGYLKDRDISAQLQEKRYAVKEVLYDDEEKTYYLALKDRAGEETRISITGALLKKENFSEGDLVYVSPKGIPEQAYLPGDR